MATRLMENKNVEYLCGCGKWRPVYRIYLCRHCLKYRCGDCVKHEVDSPYCPNCLENMPSTEAKLKKNRCSNCFDCPSCGNTLTTRATSQMVSNPDDPGKSTPKKMYYLACGFCRWTTRDVGVADKTVASGAWEDKENPDSPRIFSLLEYYQQQAQKEKLEKEREKFVRRRSHLMYAASMDKYGLVSVAAKRKNLLASGPTAPSIKENEEAVIQAVKEAETVEEFSPLPDDIFTQPLQLAKKATISQRLSSLEFQPVEASDLYPTHKHLLIRRSLRCRCEHNLSKPELNPLSIKFKIQSNGFLLCPEIRLVPPPDLKFKKEAKIVLTFRNPAETNTKIQFSQPEGNKGETVTAKMDLPKKELTIGPRDDASLYDKPQDFKDDSSVIAFREVNKIGVIFKVTPLVQDGDVKICFVMKHNFRNSMTALPTENQEPEIVWLDHRIAVNLGPVLQSK